MIKQLNILACIFLMLATLVPSQKAVASDCPLFTGGDLWQWATKIDEVAVCTAHEGFTESFFQMLKSDSESRIIATNVVKYSPDVASIDMMMRSPTYFQTQAVQGALWNDNFNLAARSYACLTNGIRNMGAEEYRVMMRSKEKNPESHSVWHCRKGVKGSVTSNTGEMTQVDLMKDTLTIAKRKGLESYYDYLFFPGEYDSKKTKAVAVMLEQAATDAIRGCLHNGDCSSIKMASLGY